MNTPFISLRATVREETGPMTTPAIRLMTDAEARACVAKINANMTNIRSLVLELYEREGWSAMGHASWRECVNAEFPSSQSYLYRQLEAAQTEKVISPTGENQIPERQLRPLTKLRWILIGIVLVLMISELPFKRRKR